jgi:hypothetical protein
VDERLHANAHMLRRDTKQLSGSLGTYRDLAVRKQRVDRLSGP